MGYIAVQRAQSFALKRASAAQATSAAAALGGSAFMKEALAAAGGQNNSPPAPPKSLLAKHPSLLLRFRPEGKVVMIRTPLWTLNSSHLRQAPL